MVEEIITQISNSQVMQAKDLISDVIPFLKTSDLGIDALNWMDIFKVSHLPIVNNTQLLGLISDTDIYDLNMAHESVGNHKLSIANTYVIANQHVYDVIELMSRCKLTACPVLNSEFNYIGIISYSEIIHRFAELGALQTPGGIIVLELNVNDYSLSEISQIVEGNNAKVLSLYVTPIANTPNLEITIKLNKVDLTSVIQTFYRYNYDVKATFNNGNEVETVNKERFESFINYLNI